MLQHRPRQPDRSILEHDRKREIWEKKFTYKQGLLDELDKEEEESVPCPLGCRSKANTFRLNDDEREEIEQKYAKFVKKLEDEEKKAAKGSREAGAPKLQFKGHEVHKMADAKEKEMDRMGKAFNMPSNYEEGSHWRRQEERTKRALERDRNDEQDIGRD